MPNAPTLHVAGLSSWKFFVFFLFGQSYFVWRVCAIDFVIVVPRAPLLYLPLRICVKVRLMEPLLHDSSLQES